MKQIVYIIGHRSSDPFRIRNLLFVVKWLQSIKTILFYHYDIILTVVIIEQDIKPTINNMIGDYVNYIFAYNANEYNRGWAFNIGFVKFKNADFFYFADNDIILNTNDMMTIFLKSFQYDAIIPYAEIYNTKSKIFEDHITIIADVNELI